MGGRRRRPGAPRIRRARPGPGRTLIEDHATRSGLGAAFSAFSVWIADCTTHAGVDDDPALFGSRLGGPVSGCPGG